MTYCLRRMKQVGLCQTRFEIRKVYGKSSPIATDVNDMPEEEFALCCGLGDYVLRELPQGIAASYLPFTMFTFLPGVPEDNEFVVTFQSLCTAKTGGGTAYFSPFRPTLTIGGEQLVVSFSDHAVRCIHERATSSDNRYLDAWYASLSLYGRSYFELWQPRAGNVGFIFYQECVPGTVRWQGCTRYREGLSAHTGVLLSLGVLPCCGRKRLPTGKDASSSRNERDSRVAAR